MVKLEKMWILKLTTRKVKRRHALVRAQDHIVGLGPILDLGIIVGHTNLEWGRCVNPWGRIQQAWGRKVWDRMDREWHRMRKVWGSSDQVSDRMDNTWGRMDSVWAQMDRVWDQMDMVWDRIGRQWDLSRERLNLVTETDDMLLQIALGPTSHTWEKISTEMTSGPWAVCTEWILRQI